MIKINEKNYDLLFHGCYAIFQEGRKKEDFDFPIALFMDKSDAECYLKALAFKYDGLKMPFYLKEIYNTNLFLNFKEEVDNE